jgi:hypothetical protein
MKNIIMSLFILVSTAVFGQQIPNSDFESWDAVSAGNGDKPSSWNTVNSSLGSLGFTIGKTCVQTADAHAGSYAIQLTTVDPPAFPLNNPDINGVAATGDIQTTSPYGVTGGVSFTEKPDSLVGYFKYSQAGSDRGTVEMVLKNGTEDTIAHARFVTPSSSVSQYTRFSVPFNYRNSNTPSKAVNLISSSDGFNAVVGSQIFVDDLEVIYNTIIAVAEIIETRVEVYYASNKLFIDNPEQENIGDILVYNAAGQHVKSISIGHLSTKNLPQGFYTYVIPAVGITGKFIR